MRAVSGGKPADATRAEPIARRRGTPTSPGYRSVPWRATGGCRVGGRVGERGRTCRRSRHGAARGPTRGARTGTRPRTVEGTRWPAAEPGRGVRDVAQLRTPAHGPAPGAAAPIPRG